jgi:hypothetical protein
MLLMLIASPLLANGIWVTACQILHVAHALTGCDTTSSLFRIGKQSVFKLLRNCPKQYFELATGPLPVFFEGGAVTSQRVLKVLFYVNILQCFFVVENFTANAVSVETGLEQLGL